MSSRDTIPALAIHLGDMQSLMTSEALEHLIRIAPTGTVITIVTIRGPKERPAQSHRTEGDVSDLLGEAETLLQTAERIHCEQGNGPFKPKEWADLMPDLSVREIERAVKHGALKGFPKTTGRDHGATVISTGEMLRYLRICERVQQGAPRPEWYSTVVKR